MENNEQKETNLRLCKKCNQVKRRTLNGKYPDQRDKKWTDDTGKLWNGRICPSCQVEKAREAMQRKRAKNAETSK